MKLTFPAVLAVLLLAVGVRAQTTVFTYHGQLQANGAPANGLYELRFTLQDASSGGNQVGNAITNAPVGVTNGLFVTLLNFGGSPFNGNDCWLEIGVRTNGGTNAYTVLSPRQQITSVPYAIRAANFSGTLPAANLTGTLPDALLSPNVARLNTNAFFLGNVTAVQFNGSGAGLTSVPATNLTGTLPDARLSTNVALLNAPANFSGNVSAPFLSGNGTGLTNVPGRIFEVIPTATNIQSLANTGYLATNDFSSVVVTLPLTANIRVGETVRVSASGAGGWILAQNTNQVILTGNLLGPIGVNWATNASVQTWRSIASSANGRRLAAAAASGIYASTDYGATWGLQAGSPNAVSVASSGDGSKLVAVVNGSFIYTWTDVNPTWTPHSPSAAWSSVASSLDGSKLVATINPSGQIYTSVNSGANWGVQAQSPVRSWTSIASSADGQKLVATAQGGMIYTSTNAGANWSPHESNRSWASVASSADGNLLVAAANGGQVFVSTDSGANWTATTAPISAPWSSVTSSADGSRLAAVYNPGGVFISTDSGVTWTSRTLPAVGWTTVAFSGDGSTLALAGNSSRIFVSSQATTTPGTVGYLSGSRLSAVEVVHCGGGVFMPITSMGTVRVN